MLFIPLTIVISCITPSLSGRLNLAWSADHVSASGKRALVSWLCIRPYVCAMAYGSIQSARAVRRYTYLRECTAAQMYIGMTVFTVFCTGSPAGNCFMPDFDVQLMHNTNILHNPRIFICGMG